MIGDCFRALRHAVRNLRRNAGFTLTALLTLTFAISANSAIFTLANALMFAGLPLPDPGRLIDISTLGPNGAKSGLSIPERDHLTPSRCAVIGYRAWQERWHGDPAVIGKVFHLNVKPSRSLAFIRKGFPG